MSKLSLGLLLSLVVCAIALVASTHQARRLFAELEREQQRGRQLEVEYGQLQIEASTWGLHARVARIATSQLGLGPAEVIRTRIVPARPAGGATSGMPVASGETATTTASVP